MTDLCNVCGDWHGDPMCDPDPIDDDEEQP